MVHGPDKPYSGIRRDRIAAIRAARDTPRSSLRSPRLVELEEEILDHHKNLVISLQGVKDAVREASLGGSKEKAEIARRIFNNKIDQIKGRYDALSLEEKHVFGEHFCARRAVRISILEVRSLSGEERRSAENDLEILEYFAKALELDV